MFQKTDFWIGLAVGAVAGIFGYRFMQEREACSVRKKSWKT